MISRAAFCLDIGNGLIGNIAVAMKGGTVTANNNKQGANIFNSSRRSTAFEQK